MNKPQMLQLETLSPMTPCPCAQAAVAFDGLGHVLSPVRVSLYQLCDLLASDPVLLQK